jgi:hypothetical protein
MVKKAFRGILAKILVFSPAPSSAVRSVDLGVAYELKRLCARRTSTRSDADGIPTTVYRREPSDVAAAT